MYRRLVARAASVAVVAIVLAGTQMLAPSSSAVPQSSSSSIGFSGNANVAEAHLIKSGPNYVVNVGPISDTGQLPSSGGMLDRSLLTVCYPTTDPPCQNDPTSQVNLKAEVAAAMTEGSGNTDSADSMASVALVHLVLGSPPQLTIDADVLKANSQASCSNGAASTSGSADIASLYINGQGFTAAAPPNTTITIPGPPGGPNIATVTLNEQKSSTSGGNGSIDVNALHVTVLDGQAADVIISHAHSDVTNCPSGPKPPPPPCPVLDFATGGGYIVVNGSKVTFGLVGGQKPNGLQGHLTVTDHGTGKKIQAGTVTAYSAPASNTRQITYQDSSGNTWVVTVTDNGEPGTSDTFSVSGPGYSASGTLGGGNIEIHHPGGCQSSKGHGH